MSINLRSFKQRARIRKASFRRFLGLTAKKSPAKLDQLSSVIHKDLWNEIDCLGCANCCKTMTPTYTKKDIRRIAEFLNMTEQAFKDKWLRKERNTGDWLNKSTPCQFLDLKTNMCSIYAVRPDDCAGFPHLHKKKWVDYLHVHKQNVELCPATYRMVERMIKTVEETSHPL